MGNLLPGEPLCTAVTYSLNAGYMSSSTLVILTFLARFAGLARGPEREHFAVGYRGRGGHAVADAVAWHSGRSENPQRLSESAAIM